MQNSLIVIIGPTGVGKTDLTIKLASNINTEIISCDSRQFYREMSIGTAVPEPEQLSTVKHHFIGHLSVKQDYSSSMFEKDVLSLLPDLFKSCGNVIMTGGSGLYIEAVTRGIDDIPSLEPGVRQLYTEKYEREGIEGLRAELRIIDPLYYEQVDLRNHKRILRALEISASAGKPYSSFLKKEYKKREFNIVKVGLNRDREELYHRIDKRVDKMVEDGLENEVKSLTGYRNLNALNTVGYREFFDYFDGNIDLAKAIELIKRNSRHYARKQLTWFTRDKEIEWFHPDKQSDIESYISERIRQAP